MAYGISFPSTRVTSYALRAAYGGIGLDVVLSHDKLLENSAAGTVIGTLACTGVIGTPRFALIDNAAGRVALGGTNNATVLAGLVPSDYETTPFFNFTVSITGTSPQLPNIIFTVFVGDANEFPPVIISDGGSTTAVVSIPENSTAVTTVVATDADIGSVVTYSIVGGADASKFTIGMGDQRAILAAEGQAGGGAHPHIVFAGPRPIGMRPAHPARIVAAPARHGRHLHLPLSANLTR